MEAHLSSLDNEQEWYILWRDLKGYEYVGTSYKRAVGLSSDVMGGKYQFYLICDTKVTCMTQNGRMVTSAEMSRFVKGSIFVWELSRKNKNHKTKINSLLLKQRNKEINSTYVVFLYKNLVRYLPKEEFILIQLTLSDKDFSC